MNVIARIAAAAGLCCAGAALAATDDPGAAALPDDVELRELLRYSRTADANTLGYHYSGVSLPASFARYAQDGSLGFVSATPFAGSRALYGCAVRYRVEDPSPFTSGDPKCEGWLSTPSAEIVGYVSATPIAGTVPLYRCYFAGGGRLDHFDSLSDDCDGNKRARRDGVLGYVFL